MLLNVNELYSDGQAVTATAVSTSTIDHNPNPGTAYNGQAIVRDIGPGQRLQLFAKVTEAFATLTSLKVSLESSADDSTYVIHWITDAILLATLVIGYDIPLPGFPSRAVRRYTRLRYTVAGSNATAGKITAGIVLDLDTNPSH